MSYGTRFVEAEAILAAQANDWEQVDEILDAMLPKELYALARAANMLATEANEIASAKMRIQRKRGIPD